MMSLLMMVVHHHHDVDDVMIMITARRPKLRFKDVCKADMKQCNIVLDTWESLADDRSAWRQAVRQGTSAEAARDEAAETAAPAAIRLYLHQVQ
jgi:hypothetical protein